VADVADDSAGPDDEDTSAAPDREAKPKNTVDDQLNKAVEVLKARSS
jgi:hypothetical protein